MADNRGRKVQGSSQKIELTMWHQLRKVQQALPDRDCIVWGKQRRSYSEVYKRSEKLAKFFASKGLGCSVERESLANYESGQDHVAVYLYNGPEYVETSLACFGARAVTVNVNYRYVGVELKYILEKSKSKTLVYDHRFADNISSIIADLKGVEILIEVGGNGEPKVEGALAYECLMDENYEGIELPEQKPEDLSIIFTGGTTGMPKAVLWQHSDLWWTLGGAAHPVTGKLFSTLDELLELGKKDRTSVLCIPPLMHLTGYSLILMCLCAGSTLAFAETPERLVAEQIWQMVGDEKINLICSVGNAMAQPLLEELETNEGSGKNKYDLSSLNVIVNGGAAMGERVRNGLLDRLHDHAMVVDGVGSSEGGKQLSVVFTKAKRIQSKVEYRAGPNCRIVSLDRKKILTAEEESEGWLASIGTLPLGYLNEKEKTEETFPTIDGVRYSIPGDKAVYKSGKVILLGRDSVTINTGGEKVFAEEVELAILANEKVQDVVVVGRASERWGEEVVAVVAVKEQFKNSLTSEDVLKSCEGVIARYKMPKVVLWVDAVVRGPNGKVDYKWAKALAADSLNNQEKYQFQNAAKLDAVASELADA